MVERRVPALEPSDSENRSRSAYGGHQRAHEQDIPDDFEHALREYEIRQKTKLPKNVHKAIMDNGRKLKLKFDLT